MKRILWVWLLILLASCGTPQAATPGPTPEAINVYIPASMQTWADRLANCATKEPQVALYFFQTNLLADESNLNSIVLDIGQPSTKTGSLKAYQVGSEQIVVVVNKANPLSRGSAALLRQLFRGEVLNWDGGAGQKIQVWMMPEGEPVRQIFDDALNLIQPLAADALLAPDSGAMLGAVGNDENAIGYLPKSFLDASDQADKDKVKLLQLDDAIEQALHQPVLAFTRNEPAGSERNLVVCLQNSGDN